MILILVMLSTKMKLITIVIKTLRITGFELALFGGKTRHSTFEMSDVGNYPQKFF